ncbi:patatin-like phospholipase family protein [Aquamicrobium sp. LC103]|uniref:patatin-like phospholipase family protein n=1 Tax=Aquamicrobium sp. LC103 TaxID=1120658 RepID=UPI0009E43287|nr:patatin-like phospholipase family protein [Aquamicrobium sp. LC103]TKT69185.1 patatin-like phospholipase family protein [Aquamicrobium sp. LC103]
MKTAAETETETGKVPQHSGKSAGPTFAVAFGGGGARGLAHIHIIETLDELGIKPVAISGSSIGALMGAGMAAGLSGRYIHDYSRDVLAHPSEVASRMWRARPGSFGEMVAGVGFTQFNVERILQSFLPPEIPATFEELQIPLQVTATDFFAHSQMVLDKGALLPALAASAAIPAVFRPIKHEGRTLVDGGISNPVPFDLLENRADIVIAIDVVGTPVATGGKLTSVDLMLGANQIMMQSIIALKLQRSRPQIMLRPRVSRFRVLDFLKVEHVLSETVSVKDELKQAIDAAVERVEIND